MSAQSRQFVVLEAVVAALGGPAQGAYRCRLDDFAQAELPADNVMPEAESASYEDTDGTELTFRFHIRHLAVAKTGADALADQRYVRGAQLLLADPTLGGVVRYTRLIGRKWEMERSELQVMAVVATYEVEFSSTRRDPSVAGY